LSALDIADSIMEDANQIANQANQGSVTFPVTVVVSFYLTEASNKQKVLLHKEKTRFPLSNTKHIRLETLKKDVLEYCDIRSLAGQKGLGLNIDCSFLRTVRQPGVVESFSIRTQSQWENEMPLIMERNNILQGIVFFWKYLN
jgi:hypothetical protein